MVITETSITRRLTWDESIAALKHLRFDFTDELARAILYALAERFKLAIAGLSYAVSYDSGESMFFLTAWNYSARTLLAHEASGDRCWCLLLSDAEPTPVQLRTDGMWPR